MFNFTESGMIIRACRKRKDGNGQRVQNISYIMIKFRDLINIQHGDYSYNNVYLKFARRVDLKVFSHPHKTTGN